MKEIRIPQGYQFKKKTKKVDLFAAHRIFKGREKRRYTVAERVGEQIRLTAHVLRCPYCGKEVPAYRRFLYPTAETEDFEIDFDGWLEQQFSFDAAPPVTLQLQRPEDYRKRFVCPRCGNTSRRADEEVLVTVDANKNGIYLIRELESFSDICAVGWARQEIGLQEDNLFEGIVFDLQGGTTTFAIFDQSKRVLEQRNFETFSKRRELSGLGLLVEESLMLKRELHRLFTEAWPSPLPFQPAELSMLRLALMTRFKGFDRGFYDAVPLTETPRLDPSFDTVAEQLGSVEEAFALLDRSSLPATKSIRRFFAQNSGLFFYLRECELLCSLLDADVNHLRRLLTHTCIYDHLADLHIYPALELFLRAFGRVKGVGKLFSLLNTEWPKMMEMAFHYAMKDEAGRRADEQSWMASGYIKRYKRWVFDPLRPTFSLPVLRDLIPEDIPDCVIRGYCFRWLRTTRDFRDAARALDNCLENWWQVDATSVLTVSYGGTILAAVEVDGCEINQALTKRNGSIPKDSPLYAIIDHWRKQNGLLWDN